MSKILNKRTPGRFWKEAIDICDHIAQTELKENHLKYVPLLGTKIRFYLKVADLRRRGHSSKLS